MIHVYIWTLNNNEVWENKKTEIISKIQKYNTLYERPENPTIVGLYTDDDMAIIFNHIRFDKAHVDLYNVLYKLETLKQKSFKDICGITVKSDYTINISTKRRILGLQ
jgi:hypothetical protein